MKLINKLTAWYLGVTLVVILIGGVIAYYQVKAEINRTQINRLRTFNDATAARIEKGLPSGFETFNPPAEVTVLDSAVTSNTFTVSEDSRYNQELGNNECRVSVDSYYQINGQNYRVRSHNSVKKTHEIFQGLLNSFLAILVLLLLLIGISARFISNSVLLPFKQTLQAIQSFHLKDKNRLRFSKNRTKEFTELNNFLESMTDKAIHDYSMLKEFGENASHELQTPLAIMRSKLDLLSQSKLDDEQATLIGDIQKNIEKLSRINQSLILLSKLENKEFDTSENIFFCRAAKESVAGFEELIEMKSIELKKDIEKDVPIKFHPALADILLNNLLSNAIRHNVTEGKIELTLTHQSLVVKNTGNPPSVPTEELFQRFKKGNPCDNSIGIGLSIVKQICDLNQMPLRYIYANGWHTVEVKFA